MAGGQLRIETMWAFIALDPADNTEGVVAFPDAQSGMFMPAVGADRKMVDMLRPVVEAIAASHRSRITLVEFEVRREVEYLDPSFGMWVKSDG